MLWLLIAIAVVCFVHGLDWIAAKLTNKVTTSWFVTICFSLMYMVFAGGLLYVISEFLLKRSR